MTINRRDFLKGLVITVACPTTITKMSAEEWKVTSPPKLSALEQINAKRAQDIVIKELTTLSTFIIETAICEGMTHLNAFSFGLPKLETLMERFKNTRLIQDYWIVMDDRNHPPSVIDNKLLNIDVEFQIYKIPQLVRFHAGWDPGVVYDLDLSSLSSSEITPPVIV